MPKRNSQKRTRINELFYTGIREDLLHGHEMLSERVLRILLSVTCIHGTLVRLARTREPTPLHSDLELVCPTDLCDIRR